MLSFPWKSEKAYQEWYSQGVFHSEQQEEEGLKPYCSEERDLEFRKVAGLRLKQLKLFKIPNRRVLDIGCATGAFVAEANNTGYQAEGIDPCEAAIHWGRERARSVERGEWKDLARRDEKWGVITLHDVYEHDTRPSALLAMVERRLSPGGIVVVEMPELDSAEHRAKGMEWRCILPDQHVVLYSDGAARLMFERAGLYVIAAIRPLNAKVGKVSYYLMRESDILL